MAKKITKKIHGARGSEYHAKRARRELRVKRERLARVARLAARRLAKEVS